MKISQKQTHPKQSQHSKRTTPHQQNYNVQQNIEFPHIVINETPQAGKQHAHKPRDMTLRDSLNLNSVYAHDPRDSIFLKSNDSYDNMYFPYANEPVVAQTIIPTLEKSNHKGDEEMKGNNNNGNADSHQQVKIHFTVPKLAALVNLNRGTADTFTSLPGKNSARVPLPSNAAYSYDDDDTPNNSPLNKGKRESFESPQPLAKAMTLSTRPSAKQPQMNHGTAEQNSNDKNRFYIDPLTQERKYVGEATEQTLIKGENKSLKDLLVDALQDFYIRNDQIPLQNEYDVKTLEKAGLPRRDIQAIHEGIISGKQSKKMNVQTNVISVQVVTSSSNPATARKSYEESGRGGALWSNAGSTMNNLENSRLSSRGFINQGGSSSGNNTARNMNYVHPPIPANAPLVYEVKQMFDDEIFPPNDPMVTHRSGVPAHQRNNRKSQNGGRTDEDTKTNNNQKGSREGKVRPTSANALMMNDMKHRLNQKYQQLSKSIKHKHLLPQPSSANGSDGMLYIAAKSYPAPNVNSAAPSSIPSDLNSPGKPQESPKREAIEKVSSPTSLRALPDELEALSLSPRTTTVMLLSHEIFAKHEQQKQRTAFLPTPILEKHRVQTVQHQNELTAQQQILEKRYDKPITVVDTTPSKESIVNEVTHIRNQRRLKQIIETEAVASSEQNNSVKKAVNHPKEKEASLLPPDLQMKMQKQLSRFQEIVHHKPNPNSAIVEPGASIGPPLVSFADTIPSFDGSESPKKIEEDDEHTEINSLPKVQWKGFIQNPPLDANPFAGISSPPGTDRGNATTIRSFKNVNKVLLQVPITAEHHTNSPVTYNSTLRSASKSNLSLSSNHAHPHSSRAHHDDVDHDFMTIPDDVYLNDSLFFAERRLSMKIGGAQGGIDEILATGVLGDQSTPQPPVMHNKQLDTVKLNPHIASDRIDKKHNQAFLYPSTASPIPLRRSSITYAPDDVHLAMNDQKHNYRPSPLQTGTVAVSPNLKSRKIREPEREGQRVQGIKIDSEKVKISPKPPPPTSPSMMSSKGSPSYRNRARVNSGGIVVGEEKKSQLITEEFVSPELRPAVPPSHLENIDNVRSDERIEVVKSADIKGSVPSLISTPLVPETNSRPLSAAVAPNLNQVIVSPI